MAPGGGTDDFVSPKWGKATAVRLRDFGVDVRDLVSMIGAEREMTRKELEMLFEFVLDLE